MLHLAGLAPLPATAAAAAATTALSHRSHHAGDVVMQHTEGTQPPASWDEWLAASVAQLRQHSLFRTLRPTVPGLSAVEVRARAGVHRQPAGACYQRHMLWVKP